jgi:hypothetical protein
MSSKSRTSTRSEAIVSVLIDGELRALESSEFSIVLTTDLEAEVLAQLDDERVAALEVRVELDGMELILTPAP